MADIKDKEFALAVMKNGGAPKDKAGWEVIAAELSDKPTYNQVRQRLPALYKKWEKDVADHKNAGASGDATGNNPVEKKKRAPAKKKAAQDPADDDADEDVATGGDEEGGGQSNDVQAVSATTSVKKAVRGRPKKVVQDGGIDKPKPARKAVAPRGKKAKEAQPVEMDVDNSAEKDAEHDDDSGTSPT